MGRNCWDTWERAAHCSHSSVQAFLNPSSSLSAFAPAPPGKGDNPHCTGVGKARNQRELAQLVVMLLDLELTEQGRVMEHGKGTWSRCCSCQEPPLLGSAGELTLQEHHVQGIHVGLVDTAQHVLENLILMDWQLADGRRPSVRYKHVGLGT